MKPASIIFLILAVLLVGGGFYLTASVLTAGGANSVRRGGGATGAINHGGLGYAIMRTTHALSGVGLFVLLNGHIVSPYRGNGGVIPDVSLSVDAEQPAADHRCRGNSRRHLH